MIAQQVIRHLQELHQDPEWATFVELADGTGGARGARSHQQRSRQ